MAAAWPTARHRVNDIELHVVEAGPESGPLVVLLHGFPDFWWSWRRQVGPLAERGYRVVVPDQRGYDLSDKPSGVAAYALDNLVADVVGLADAYGRDSFNLAGHDWGGVVAWGTAIRHPERVARLVVMDAPHPDVWARQALRHPTQLLRSLYVAFFQLPRLPEALLRARNFAPLRRALTTTSRPGVFAPEDLDRYVAAWSQPGALTAMLNYYRALRRRPTVGATPARVRPPTLVVWGGRNAFLERHLFKASLDLCDRGAGLFLDDASHWVHLEEAKTVTAALLRFLDDA
jgi:pimeloyl-ACP methyl ester carboxylesterase